LPAVRVRLFIPLQAYQSATAHEKRTGEPQLVTSRLVAYVGNKTLAPHGMVEVTPDRAHPGQLKAQLSEELAAKLEPKPPEASTEEAPKKRGPGRPRKHPKPEAEAVAATE
jgi:hypothetical protein